MTNTLNVDNPNLEGAGENQSSVSQGKENSIASAPQSSQEFLQLKQRLDRTESELKGLQSRQDKDKNEVQRFMEDVKAHVAKGLSLDEAEQAVTADRKAAEKDDLLYQIAQKVGVLGGSSQNVAGNNSNATDDVAKVFEEYDVPINDPESTPLLGLQGADLIKAVSKLALKRAKSQTLDSSEAGSIRGGPPAPKATGEALVGEYKTKMRAAMGKPKEVTALREQYKKQGVDVYNIDFS